MNSRKYNEHGLKSSYPLIRRPKDTTIFWSSTETELDAHCRRTLAILVLRDMVRKQ